MVAITNTKPTAMVVSFREGQQIFKASDFTSFTNSKTRTKTTYMLMVIYEVRFINLTR